MGICTSKCPFSLDGEGWDEGENNPLISFYSPHPTLSATAPALLYLLHPCSHPAGEG
jgi:hypothetical protein